jgi:hypothetical protein
MPVGVALRSKVVVEGSSEAGGEGWLMGDAIDEGTIKSSRFM